MNIQKRPQKMVLITIDRKSGSMSIMIRVYIWNTNFVQSVLWYVLLLVVTNYFAWRIEKAEENVKLILINLDFAG